MRNLKKFLALVLVFMMAMSLMATASAATNNVKFSDSESVTEAFKEDVTIVSGMKVVQGYTDGSFKPTKTITRAEMAAIVYRIATGDTDPQGRYATNYAGWATEKFSDKNLLGQYDWASGYIGYCANAEFIVGYPDGTFHPEREVTGYQALAMILRAMGYNQKGQNFTGDNWSIRVSQIARDRGMLVNIDRTSYGNALRVAAPRELIAEMAFQGLTKAQVRWTESLGYQITGMDGRPGLGTENPSLGYQNFGLTHHKGVVLGNQASGEGSTKVGFSLDVTTDKGLNIGEQDEGNAGWTVTGSIKSAAINDSADRNAYYYSSGMVVNADNSVDGNVTLSFDYKSDLTLFNHAVDVWYNCNGASTNKVDLTVGTSSFNPGSVTFRDDLTTYAMFDRGNGTVIKGGDWSKDGSDDPLLGNAYPDALYNYAFARMERESNPGTSHDYVIQGTDMPDNSAASPIMENNATANTDTHPLYLVVDNGNQEVVISLNLTVSKVVQDNDTLKPLSTGILTENDSTANGNGAGVNDNAYFDIWDQNDPTNDTYDYSNIADDKRVDDVENNDLERGDYVAAVTVTGTNGDGNIGIDDATATVTKATGNETGNAGNSLNSNYYYQMEKLTKKVTAKLIKWDKDTHEVTIDKKDENGEYVKIPRSVFALAVDGSFMGREHVEAPDHAGNDTLTFWLDEEGNWMFWDEDTSKTATFVYGTYLDFTTKPGSANFAYPFIYTDEKGEPRQTASLISIDGNDMTNALYSDSMLPKRTTVGDNSSGFTPGQYIGYAMATDDKGLSSLSTTLTDTGFTQAGTTAYAGWGDWNDFGALGKTTTIDGDSVAITAHPVGDEGNLFLTNRTKFIVVSGAGTDNQVVNVYEGLNNLLTKNGKEDNKEVEIDATTFPVSGGAIAEGQNAFNSTNYAGEDAPWEMIYWSLEQTPYAQDYDQSDKFIETVFIPELLLEWTPKDPDTNSNLYFVGDNKYGKIDADNDATEYTFYQAKDGTITEQVMWIDGMYDGNDDSDADTVMALGENVFYMLTERGEDKAKDGKQIYKLVPFTKQSDADGVIIGKYYGSADDVPSSVSTTTAAETKVMADVLTTKAYLATTRYSQAAYIGGRTAGFLYNVDKAVVKDLSGSGYVINTPQDLNDASSLTSNQGVPVSCILDADATKGVSYIYVNVNP